MTTEEAVGRVFSRLLAGQLTEPIGPVQDGWEVELPSGRTVARSMLQSEAGALTALGPDAVPHLLRWVAHEHPALRYVAAYALEQITGEKPQVPYFDRDEHGAERQKAVDVWARWYRVYRASH